MEFMLLLWDEWDDLKGACRHLAGATADELAGFTAPLAAVASASGMWFVTTQAHLGAAIVARAATAWGAYRQLLPWMS